MCASSPNTPHFRAYQGQPDPLTALLREPFLLREDNSGTKQETLYFLQNHGLSLDELNVIAVMDDAAALKRCIALGMGISILSRALKSNTTLTTLNLRGEHKRSSTNGIHQQSTLFLSLIHI